MSSPILEVKNISKSFSGNQVLSGINFNVKKGEVHALIGENGAGKSTLMNIIGGILRPDTGEVLLDGVQTDFNNPIQAMQAGISIVHQELSLAENLSVAQNIYLRREITNSLGFIKWKEIRAEAKKIFNIIGIDIDPDQQVGQLSVGMQQVVEIAKAIALNAKIIIMDEPTSSLSEREIGRLFTLIRELTDKGVSVVFISHKIGEIMDISDRVSVLRDGVLISTDNTIDTNSTEIINNMVGRELSNLYPEKSTIVGEIILCCKNLTRRGYFKNISFELKKGEILGFAGLIGSGRTEVVRGLVGADRLSSGEITLYGKTVTFKNPRDAISKDICYLTEDRKVQGLFLSYSVRKNIVASNLDAFNSKFGFIKENERKKESLRLSKLMTIRPNDDELEVSNLSGGNQQKSLLAKWLSPKPKILIVDEPTRGVDIGAKSLIHQRLRELTEQGISIIMISSEMPEVIGLSDRIAVFKEGKISAVLDNSRTEITQNEIMKNATV